MTAMNNWVDLLKSKRAYLLAVALPACVLGAYLWVFASDIYESTASFIINGGSQAPQVTSISQPPDSPKAGTPISDALVVEHFILSPEMLDALQLKMNVRAHYADKSNDIVSRLNSDASSETFFAYYVGNYLHSGAWHPPVVSVLVDVSSGVIEVSAKAYSARYAQELLAALLSRCSDYVNEASQQAATEQVKFLFNEVAAASKKMQETSAALKSLQDHYGVLSPGGEISNQNQLVAGLEMRLAEGRTELSRLQSFLAAGTTEIAMQQHLIRALEKQIARERSKQAGSSESSLNELTLKYREAEVAASIATQSYQAVNSALEAERLRSVQKFRTAQIVSHATLPDAALYPRKLYSWLTALVLLHFIFGIAVLWRAMIEDHRE